VCSNCKCGNEDAHVLLWVCGMHLPSRTMWMLDWVVMVQVIPCLCRWQSNALLMQMADVEREIVRAMQQVASLWRCALVAIVASVCTWSHLCSYVDAGATISYWKEIDAHWRSDFCMDHVQCSLWDFAPQWWLKIMCIYDLKLHLLCTSVASRLWANLCVQYCLGTVCNTCGSIHYPERHTLW
jgi:hypothetical protein